MSILHDEADARSTPASMELIDSNQALIDAIDETTDTLIYEYMQQIAEADTMPASSTKVKYIGRAVVLGMAINRLCKAAGLDEPIELLQTGG